LFICVLCRYDVGAVDNGFDTSADGSVVIVSVTGPDDITTHYYGHHFGLRCHGCRSMISITVRAVCSVRANSQRVVRCRRSSSCRVQFIRLMTGYSRSLEAYVAWAEGLFPTRQLRRVRLVALAGMLASRDVAF
jgi:hypothetical protein